MFTAVINFFCACSGTRKDALQRSPSGRHLAGTLGFLILLTAVIASFNAGYALYRAFLGQRFADLVGILGGAAWGCVVFSIDRLMVMGIDKFASRGRLALQVVIRLPLAGIIALVISKPLLLNVSLHVLEAQLMAERRSTTDREFAANAKESGLPDRSSDLHDLQEDRRKQEGRLQQEPDSTRFLEAKAELEKKANEHQRIKNLNDWRVPKARVQTHDIRAGREDAELSSDDVERIRNIRSQIQKWQSDLRQAENEHTKAQHEINDARLEWQEAEVQKLNKLNDGLAAATQRYQKAVTEVEEKNTASSSEIARILTPNLINQYRVLRRITSSHEHPDAQAIGIFEWGLDLLLFLLEMTPILLKALARKTPLDHAVRAVEREEEEKINLAAVELMLALQKSQEVAREVKNKALEKWKAGQLAKINNRNPDSVFTTEEMASILEAIRGMREHVEDLRIRSAVA